MGDQAPVVQPNHRMDGGLRMHNDLDLVIAQAEQVMRLNHLKALVHHRRRVDGDLGPHRPCGMREGICGHHIAEFIDGAAPERPARCREDCPLNTPRIDALQQLEQGGVLAVHWHQHCAGSRSYGGDEVTTRHKALLVGERHGNTPLEGRQRGGQARRPDKGVQHDVRLRRLDKRREIAGRRN